jgi:BetI-type transcriptional repressor, C-terminal
VQNGVAVLLGRRRFCGSGRKRKRPADLPKLGDAGIPDLQPRIAAWLREVERNFRAHVAEGIADGSIRPTVRPENKARELLALTIGSAFLFLLDSDQTDPSRLRRPAQRHIRQHVRADPPTCKYYRQWRDYASISREHLHSAYT